jgi:hypothetical protein
MAQKMSKFTSKTWHQVYICLNVRQVRRSIDFHNIGESGAFFILVSGRIVPRGANVQNYSEVYPARDTEESILWFKLGKYPLHSALAVMLNPLSPQDSTVSEFYGIGILSFFSAA